VFKKKMEVEGTATVVPEVVADGNSFLLGQHDDYVTQVAVIPTISGTAGLLCKIIESHLVNETRPFRPSQRSESACLVNKPTQPKCGTD
jgi:hypothetical protein